YVLVRIAFQYLRRSLHDLHCGRNFVRLTPLAGTEAFAFRLAGRFEEQSIFPQWPPRRTAWPAIDLRRFHAEKERTICSRIPRHGCLPVSRGGLRRNLLFRWMYPRTHYAHHEQSYRSTRNHAIRNRRSNKFLAAFPKPRREPAKHPLLRVDRD